MPDPNPENNPHVIIIAGANGSGKTTAAPFLLRDYLGIKEFVNADTIAAGLSAFDVESVAMQAGKVMLTRLRELANERASFAFETTLASRSFALWIKQLKAEGYQFHLLFLWVPEPAFSVARVAQRVQQGGHNVPDDTVFRRYDRGLSNFFKLYRPLADWWELTENTDPQTQRPIAEGIFVEEVNILSPLLWKILEDKYNA